MKVKLAILMLTTGLSTQSFSTNSFEIKHFNHFVSNSKPITITSGTSALEISNVGWRETGGGGSNVILTGPSNPTSSEGLSPLFYPNPFKLSTGSELGYHLSRNTSVTLKIYDILGNEFFSKTYPSGEKGGSLGYNKVPFNTAVLGHSHMPVGVYFYILLDDGSSVIGKGKFALLP